MDHGKKLLELLGVSSLREYVEPTTYEELMDTGGYYGDLFEKAFAQGEMQTERVQAEIARLLAEALQPEARKRYGLADTESIRRLASETFGTAAAEEWEQQMGLLREGIGREGLTPEQQSGFLDFMEGLQGPFIDMICAEAARLKLIPLENVNEVSLAVAAMVEEEGHADEVRDS